MPFKETEIKYVDLCSTKILVHMEYINWKVYTSQVSDKHLAESCCSNFSAHAAIT